MSVESRDRFDERLEQELRSHRAGYSGRIPLPAQAKYRAWHYQNELRVSVFAKAVTLAVSTKAAVAMIVVAAAVGATGAGEAAITGSVNPADWGQRLVQQIQSCSTELMSGSANAGACVSSFTRNAAAPAPADPDLTGSASGAPGTNQGGGQPESHPGNGPPATHPGNGPPTSKAPKPTQTPGVKKPKTHPVGGPFGTAGPPTSHRPH